MDLNKPGRKSPYIMLRNQKLNSGCLSLDTKTLIRSVHGLNKTKAYHSPLILLRLRTRITVHALTAAWQQTNRNSGAWMSQICGEWRDLLYKDFIPDRNGPSAKSKIRDTMCEI